MVSKCPQSRSDKMKGTKGHGYSYEGKEVEKLTVTSTTFVNSNKDELIM